MRNLRGSRPHAASPRCTWPRATPPPRALRPPAPLSADAVNMHDDAFLWDPSGLQRFLMLSVWPLPLPPQALRLTSGSPEPPPRHVAILCVLKHFEAIALERFPKAS